MAGWEIALRIIATLVLPYVGAVLAYLFAHRSLKFRKLPKIVRYIIEGVFFAAISIGVGYFCGAEITYTSSAGVEATVRFGTTALGVYLAGVLFDWPAPLIAAGITALFRGLINFNDIISIAVVFTILFSAGVSILLKYLVFRKEKIRWYYAALGTTLIECFNNIMIFVFATTTIEAYQILQVVDMVVLLTEFICVAAVFITLDLLHHRFNKHLGRKISNKVQRWIFISTVIATIGLAVGSYFLTSNKSYRDAKEDLFLTMESVYNDISPAKKESTVEEYEMKLRSLVSNRHLQSTGFVVLINYDETTITPEVGPFPPHKIKIKPGSVMSCKSTMWSQVIGYTPGTTPDPEVDDYILKYNNGLTYLDLKNHVTPISESIDSTKINFFTLTFDNSIEKGKLFLGCYTTYHDNQFKKDYGILTVLSDNEINLNANIISRALIYSEIVAFIALYAVVYVLITRIVVNKIRNVNTALGQIMDGDINVHLEIKDSEEFEELSNDINLAVGALKNYGEEINRRIEDDLELARNIQYNSVPLIFPFENEFEIYATMYTAKEVGGDFYDYLKLPNNRVMILIADVSGKGIPASLHMMRAKTLIKSLAHTMEKPEEMLKIANNELCYQNKAGLFVTAWLGILNTKTGMLDYANAGHCAPLYRHDGQWSYLKGNKNFVLGGFDGLNYKPNQIQLAPGDMILLYTDGVTEATSKDEELFGEERLLKAVQESGVNTNSELLVDKICDLINKFQSGVNQFDDVTLLSVRYFGARDESAGKDDIDFAAHFGNISTAVNFIQHRLMPFQIDPKYVNEISLAANEIIDNIVRYAYKDNPNGAFHIKVEVNEFDVLITFTDSGVPFDPTQVRTGKNVEGERENLGIFIAKKSVDGVRYRRINNQNVFTLIKHRKKD